MPQSNPVVRVRTGGMSGPHQRALPNLFAGYLVILRVGWTLVVGGAGEITNVTHVFPAIGPVLRGEFLVALEIEIALHVPDRGDEADPGRCRPLATGSNPPDRRPLSQPTSL